MAEQVASEWVWQVAIEQASSQTRCVKFIPTGLPRNFDAKIPWIFNDFSMTKWENSMTKKQAAEA